MFTTVQDIRERAGFLNFAIDKTLNPVTGSSNVWFVPAKDLERFVPRSYDGATIVGTSDVVVKHDGASVGYSTVDSSTGRIVLSAGYAVGSSLTATYASSPIQTQKVLDYGAQAHGTVLSYVGKRYDLPLGVSVPLLSELEARLAAARLLQDSYGVSGQNSAEDGYRMEEQIMMRLQGLASGELVLIDSDGNEVPNDTDINTGSGNAMSSGSRVEGYLFMPEEEEFTIIDPLTIRRIRTTRRR